jgi:thiamine biosynthesis lipoprotein
MACRFELTLPISDRSGVIVARQALDQVDKLERQLTVFRETSEICYINRNAASNPVCVEPSLFALMLQCKDLHRETGGAFDVSTGPLTRCWGFLKRQGRIPTPAELDEARALVGFDKLLLDRETRTVRFDRPGVEINLGSIGKGYAIDVIAAQIAGRVQTALLSAGSSSMRAVGDGDRSQGGWVVGFRHPRCKDKRLAMFRLRDAALSISGSEEQFFESAGRRYGHIIDPRTGVPAQLVSGAAVIAQTAAVSDALATAFYVGGPDLAAEYCSTHPDVLVVMLLSDAEKPLVFGRSDRCIVEMIDE